LNYPISKTKLLHLEDTALWTFFLPPYNTIFGKTSHVLAALLYAANSFIWPISFSLRWTIHKTAGNISLAEI